MSLFYVPFVCLFCFWIPHIICNGVGFERTMLRSWLTSIKYIGWMTTFPLTETQTLKAGRQKSLCFVAEPAPPWAAGDVSAWSPAAHSWTPGSSLSSQLHTLSFLLSLSVLQQPSQGSGPSCRDNLIGRGRVFLSSQRLPQITWMKYQSVRKGNNSLSALLPHSQHQAQNAAPGFLRSALISDRGYLAPIGSPTPPQGALPLALLLGYLPERAVHVHGKELLTITICHAWSQVIISISSGAQLISPLSVNGRFLLLFHWWWEWRQHKPTCLLWRSHFSGIEFTGFFVSSALKLSSLLWLSGWEWRSLVTFYI